MTRSSRVRLTKMAATENREAASCAPLDIDVRLTSMDDVSQITRCLLLKAFCTVDMTLFDDAVQLAAEYVPRPYCFDPLSSAPGVRIADGLLGGVGSLRTCSLPTARRRIDEFLSTDPLTANVPAELPLQELDETLSVLAGQISLGGEGNQIRTPALLLQSAPAGQYRDVADLTQEVASHWHYIFKRHHLMFLMFLGPGKGILELSPFAEQALKPHRIMTTSSMLVVLRPDILARRHLVEPGQRMVALQFFVLGNPSQTPEPPYCAALGRWLKTGSTDIDELLGVTTDEEKYRPMIEPKMDANSESPMICIKSDALRLPGADEASSFFNSLQAGGDLVLEVPTQRFDIDAYFQPDTKDICVDTHQMYTKHMSYIEGVQFFDNTLFGIPNSSAENMLPSSRINLEVSYAALQSAGWDLKTLRGCNGNVLVGVDDADYMYNEFIPNSTIRRRMCRNQSEELARINFAFNLRGANQLFDTEGSSSFSALWHANEEQKLAEGKARPPDFSLVLSSAWNLSPACFSRHCFRGLLSKMGRCFCFDQSAQGFVRAEGCCAAVLNQLTDLVKGAPMADFIGRGLLKSIEMAQWGTGATQRANAGCMKYIMKRTMRQIQATTSDIDAIECNSMGMPMMDANEVDSITTLFKDRLESETLPLTTLKTVIGSGHAAAGLFSLLKVLTCIQWEYISSNSMLRTLDAHVVLDNTAAIVPTEALLLNTGSVGNVNINCFGIGGTYVSAIVWGDLGVLRQAAVAEVSLPPQQVTFWPTGGGELLPEAKPTDGYYLVGSFNRWGEPAENQKMEEAVPGEYIATLELGDNEWDSFQIWLDRDPNRVLHPGCENASLHCPVFGPEATAGTFKWKINGKLVAGEKPEMNDPTVEKNKEESPKQGSSARTVLPHRFRIRLRVKGKYRAVDWERLPENIDMKTAQLGPIIQPSSEVNYQIVASSKNWAPCDMQPTEGASGSWCVEVTLNMEWEIFVIIRNGDDMQTFYPDSRHCEDNTRKILGPDELCNDRYWMLRGTPGDVFRVEFRRSVESGVDSRQVSWQLVTKGASTEGETK